ncbi:GNAT family N-acetyltransferase [Priestia aryabhattai]|uniref:GNAT family N-acetyltransferase n=1 Tax=Priestia megaterium TaxID=1404 RepID=UPI003F9B2214
MNEDSLIIKNNLEHIKWEQLSELFLEVGWNNHKVDRIVKAFENSQIVAIGYIENKVIGCGRVLTDHEFYATIYDVAIHPEFQGKGIGKAIVSNLLEHLDNISFVHLTATTGNEEFYRNLELKKHKTAMGRYLNLSLEEEYLD